MSVKPGAAATTAGREHRLLATTHRGGPHPDSGVVRRQRPDRLDGRHHHRSRHARNKCRHRDHRGHLRHGCLHSVGGQDRRPLRNASGLPDCRRDSRPRNGRGRPESEPGNAVRGASCIRRRDRPHRSRVDGLHRHELQWRSAGKGQSVTWQQQSRRPVCWRCSSPVPSRRRSGGDTRSPSSWLSRWST